MSFCTLCGAGFEFTGEHRPGCKALQPVEQEPASSGRGGPARDNAASAASADRTALLEEIAEGVVDMLDGEPSGSDSLDWALHRYGYKPTKGLTDAELEAPPADPHPALDGATTALRRQVEELTATHESALVSARTLLERAYWWVDSDVDALGGQIKAWLSSHPSPAAVPPAGTVREIEQGWSRLTYDEGFRDGQAAPCSGCAAATKLLERAERFIAQQPHDYGMGLRRDIRALLWPGSETGGACAPCDDHPDPAQAPSNPQGTGPVPVFVGDPEGEDAEPCSCEESEALKARLGRCRAILRTLRLGEVNGEAAAHALERELGR